jgi:hypothetical protein
MMKAKLITLVFALLTINCNAQVYTHVSIGNGGSLSFGYYADPDTHNADFYKVLNDFSAGYIVPLPNRAFPATVYVAAGKSIILLSPGNRTVLLTPFVGAGGIEYSKIVKNEYDGGFDPVRQYSIKPYTRLELSLVQNDHRWTATASYCKGFSFGFGMKVFIGKL